MEPIDLYDPNAIFVTLERAGFSLPPEQLKLAPEPAPEIDEDLRIAEKALHTFTRSTTVHEGTFRLRLSVNATHFIDSILPKLVRFGILEVAKATDKGQKFKMGISLSKVADALTECKGSFTAFLDLASRK
jgi:hypothetical protein